MTAWMVQNDPALAPLEKRCTVICEEISDVMFTVREKFNVIVPLFMSSPKPMMAGWTVSMANTDATIAKVLKIGSEGTPTILLIKAGAKDT